MLILTMDLEWAPDPVLRDTFSLLDGYGVSCTAFSTHDDGLSLVAHERALHPNFIDDAPDEDILEELCSLYPDAIGLRAHSLYTHSGLMPLYDQFGIEYTSNYMLYRQTNVEPIEFANGTVEYPVYFMDDDWLRRKESGQHLVLSTFLEGPGLKVFDFHPPHVSFNTPSIEYYERHKDDYWSDEPEIDRFRADGYGIREVFTDLLEYIRDHDIETFTLGELTTDNVGT